MNKALNICLVIFFLLYAIGQFSADIKMVSRLFYICFIFLTIFFIACRKSISVPTGYNDVLFFLYLFLSTLYGIHNGFLGSALNEMSAFASLWLSWKIIFFSYKNKLLDVVLIQKYLYNMMILWFLVYIFVAGGAILGFIPNDIIVALLSEWLKNRGMSIDMVEDLLQGSSGLLGMMPRLATGLNIVPLIILLLHTYKNKGANPVVWLMGLLFVFIDYGRIDILVFGMATIFAVMPSVKKILNSDKGILFFFFFLVSFVLAAVFIFDKELLEFFQSVFANDRTQASNFERISQYNDLMEGIAAAPFVGCGVGAYILNNIRNDINYWEYELQLLAFVLQLGILGFLAVVVNFVSDYVFSVWQHIRGCRMVFMFTFGVWIVASCLQGGIFFDGKLILPILFFMSLRPEKSGI